MFDSGVIGSAASALVFFAAGSAFGQDETAFSAGDTAWILTSTALVLMM